MSKVQYDYCKKYEEWLSKNKKIEECDKEEKCEQCEYKTHQWVEVD